jgi:type VI secretion system secreted protein VgrG
MTPREFQSFLPSMRQLSTANRPLRLQLGFSGGNRDDVLLPQRVHGVESVCGGLEYVVLCLALDAVLPLKTFIGVPAGIEFVTDRGEVRSVCGIVAEVRAGNSDGGLASYALVIRDALALMDLRSNSRVFRDKNEIEIIQTLFAEWIKANPLLVGAFELEIDHLLALRKFPRREFTRQYNESDGHFVRRLLKRRGIAWFIRAGRSRAGSANAGSDRPAHTLALFDGAYTVAQNKAGTVRFHRDNATEKRDTITSWCSARMLRPGQVTRYSADYLDPHGFFTTVSAQGRVDQGPNGNGFAATLGDYLVEVPHAGNDPEDFLQLGQLRMARHDYETKSFHGVGSVRDFCAGEYFTLDGHPEIDRHPQEERDFVITELRVYAVNNLPSDLAEKAERLLDSNRWTWLHGQFDALATSDANAIRSRNEFTAIRRGIRIVPAYDPRVDLPPTRLETGIVVGPENEEVHCDCMGRVKIRFPSSRSADHEHADGAGASGTDADSAYVRVASNWAGNGPGSQQQCGALGLPRIGAEVLVECLGGDPDKPVIVGQLYNDLGPPPGISENGELPGNRYLPGCAAARSEAAGRTGCSWTIRRARSAPGSRAITGVANLTWDG